MSRASPGTGGRVVGKIAPELGVTLQHVGLRELSAYLLLAPALANAHLWRYRSWWDLRLERVRRLAEVRLSPVEPCAWAWASRSSPGAPSSRRGSSGPPSYSDRAAMDSGGDAR